MPCVCACTLQIELSGFKSYKQSGTPEPFSPHINVVVGANGSGKSNFFHGAPAEVHRRWAACWLHGNWCGGCLFDRPVYGAE